MYEGELTGTVDGILIIIKDLTLTRGRPTRRRSLFGSAEAPWTADAPNAARIREAGAVILGKTITPEFGWKHVTDSPVHGITRDPWNPDLTLGGSSGGAGVAVALNLGFLDQSGYRRASEETFGFKPTFGITPQLPLAP